jgi:hypothetical protein
VGGICVEVLAQSMLRRRREGTVRTPDAAMIPHHHTPHTPAGFIRPNKATAMLRLILLWTSNLQQRF